MSSWNSQASIISSFLGTQWVSPIADSWVWVSGTRRLGVDWRVSKCWRLGDDQTLIIATYRTMIINILCIVDILLTSYVKAYASVRLENCRSHNEDIELTVEAIIPSFKQMFRISCWKGYTPLKTTTWNHQLVVCSFFSPSFKDTLSGPVLLSSQDKLKHRILRLPHLWLCRRRRKQHHLST